MPKKVWKVEEFDGGINQKSDARDLEKNQLAEAFNVDVSNKGLIKIPGNGKTLYSSVNIKGENVVPSMTDSSLFSNGGYDSGWGLFQFSHDFGITSNYITRNVTFNCFTTLMRKGVEGESEFICINDGANIHLWCDNGDIGGSSDIWIPKAIKLGTVHSKVSADITKNVRPVYYKALNALRVCDSNFLRVKSSSTYKSISGNIIETNADMSAEFDFSEYPFASGLGSGEYLTFNDASNESIYNYIKINDEIMAVVKASGVYLTVYRGQFGTREQTHTDGDDIYRINVPKKFIGVSPSQIDDDVASEVYDYRLKNAIRYTDDANTVVGAAGGKVHYSGWRDTIQSLEPPHNYMIPGLSVYNGSVTAMASTGTTASPQWNVHLNEPNPEKDNAATNLTISSDSNPEKVLFSIHESNTSTIVGTQIADGGVVNGENTLLITAGTIATSFAAEGFTEGKTVIVTNSANYDGPRQIISVISDTQIKIAGEHSSNESGGFELRLEEDTISEDLQNKYIFGMSFIYEGGGSEMQESPITKGHVYTGLISHESSLGRSRDNWYSDTTAAASSALAVTDTNGWEHSNGTYHFDVSDVSGSDEEFLIYKADSDVIAEGDEYKISIDVTIESSGELTIYPPGHDSSGTSGGWIDDGSGDNTTVVLNETGTYLFRAKAPTGGTPSQVFVCSGKHDGGDITINNVQVYKATPEEMNASNAISMSSWKGAPNIFSSFNMSRNNNYLWNQEILGYKIYMKQVDFKSQTLTNEWLLVLRVNFREGEFINYSNNSEPTSLHLGNGDENGSARVYAHDGSAFVNTFVCTNKLGGNTTGRSHFDTMRNIPLETYQSENGYSADTVTCAMYKTATQIERKVYIGNILIDGIRYPDRMIESPVDRFDTFPNDDLYFIDVAIADGDEIVHLDSIGNKLVQFKKKTCYLIEVLDEGLEPLDIWQGAGIVSPSQVVKAGDGLVWVNNYGLFYYDGEKLKKITAESFDLQSWIINENQENSTILGYDEYSKKVIIMTSNLSTHDSGGYIYDLTTNSITEHQNLFNWYSTVDEFQ